MPTKLGNHRERPNDDGPFAHLRQRRVEPSAEPLLGMHGWCRAVAERACIVLIRVFIEMKTNLLLFYKNSQHRRLARQSIFSVTAAIAISLPAHL
jgi:hypothetical protein